MSKKRGQAALEFLMTYGWAIFVVLAILGVLSYTGVLSLNNLLPDVCTAAAGIYCEDMKSVHVNDNEVMISIRNQLGQEINLTDSSTLVSEACNLAGVTAETETVPETDLSSDDVKVANGKKATLRITCDSSIVADRLRMEFNLQYKNIATGIAHNHVIIIKTTVKK